MIGRTNTGGGGAGLNLKNALIHVNVPSGSTITFSFGGIAVKTFVPSKAFTNIDGVTIDYYYSISSANYGTWTITGIRDTATTSQTIEISTNDQYDCILQYLVPVGYQAVEYIESTGTQYINLNYVPSSSESYVVDFKFNNSSDNYYAFGANGGNGWSLMTAGSQFQLRTTGILYKGGSSLTSRHIFTCANRSFQVDGVTMTSTISADYKIGSGKMQIFASGTGQVVGYRNGRLYDFKTYLSGDMIHHYVPCYKKSDSVIGVYDTVTNTFYTNGGSGVFNKGADIY